MARVALGVILLLVLSPGLAGCLVGENASSPQPGELVGPTLPEGVAVSQAEVLAYGPTRAAFLWQDATSYWSDGHAAVGDPFPLEPATTELELPPDTHYELAFTLSWEASHDVDLFVRDEAGDQACTSRRASSHPPETCEIPWLPASNETRVWRIEVLGDLPVQLDADPGAFATSPEIPFTLTVEVRPTGPFGFPGKGALDGGLP